MKPFKIKLELERTKLGRIRVCSDDLPGLILSGFQTDKVMSNILPAIDALLSYKRGIKKPCDEK